MMPTQMRPRRSNDSAPHHEDRGAIAIIAALMFIPIALILALVVDAGRMWVERTALQNGVEAAAVASAHTWGSGSSVCAPADLALVAASGADPTDLTCQTVGTARQGWVEVSASEEVPLIFGTLLGRSSTEISASTTVKLGVATAVKGLWPFGLCMDHPTVAAWVASGMQDPMVAEITFEADTESCGGEVSGNWSVMNLGGGSSSNAVLKDQVINGYDGWIEVDQVVGGNPGSPSQSLNLAEAYGTQILLPLFDDPQLQGANATYRIRGFAAARLIEARFTGPSARRSLTIQFESGMLSGGVGSDPTADFGVIAWSICSYDTFGECI